MIKTFGSRAGREAWGCTKVAQRAKKRFGKLHTPDCRLIGGGRGAGCGTAWRGFGGVCLHDEVGHLWPHFRSIYFWKVITALKAALWSTHWEAWVIGKLKSPCFVHVAIFLPSSISEPTLGLPQAQQGIYLPTPSLAWPLLSPGGMLWSVSSHEWGHPETRWKRLFRTQAHPWRG